MCSELGRHVVLGLEVPAAVIISRGEGSVPGAIISAGREEEFPEHVEQCPWRQLTPTHRTHLLFNTGAAQGVCGSIMVCRRQHGGPHLCSSMITTQVLLGRSDRVYAVHTVRVLSASPTPPLP